MPQKPQLEVTLKYPGHRFKPEDFITFVEMLGFSKEWAKLGLDESDLALLHAGLMADPNIGKLIKGTGGLRKLRFSSSKWNAGKRDGARVCYVYFEQCSIVALFTVYRKGKKDTLTDAEKKVFKDVMMHLRKNLLNKPFV